MVSTTRTRTLAHTATVRNWNGTNGMMPRHWGTDKQAQTNEPNETRRPRSNGWQASDDRAPAHTDIRRHTHAHCLGIWTAYSFLPFFLLFFSHTTSGTHNTVSLASNGWASRRGFTRFFSLGGWEDQKDLACLSYTCFGGWLAGLPYFSFFFPDSCLSFALRER